MNDYGLYSINHERLNRTMAEIMYETYSKGFQRGRDNAFTPEYMNRAAFRINYPKAAALLWDEEGNPINA